MTKTQDGKHSELATIRDTVESIGIAIILAFVLRAFMVEAFVIPTGSMAPRLMGEHWDLVCPNCGYEYAFGWPPDRDNRQADHKDKSLPAKATCPNCFYVYPSKAYVNAGDRVLVMKYLYQFRPPQPWDVVVFRNPQSNQDNYIKRLIGLPGEEIQIVHGDVFFRDYKDPISQWRIRRKTPQAQEVMWQIIHDNDYRTSLKDNEKKWQPGPSDESKWEQPSDHFGREFCFKGGAAGEVVFDAKRHVFYPLYGYNSVGDSGDAGRDEQIVTDLKLSVTFVPCSADAVAILHLSSFEKRFRASISADGRVLVEHSDQLTGGNWRVWDGADVKIPPMVPGKAYELAMTNVDYRLTVLVDGQAVYQTTDKEYAANLDELIKRMEGTATLPIPAPQVKFGARGGQCDFLHVKLMRDVYYTSYPGLSQPKDNDEEFGFFMRALGVRYGDATWASMNHPIKLAKNDADPDLDSFFMMGDNSPMSLDGRLWTNASLGLRLWKHPEWNHAEKTIEENRADALYQLGTVPRYNMIGKALFVYWPSGFRAPSPIDGLPIIPNVGKMRLIR